MLAKKSISAVCIFVLCLALVGQAQDPNLVGWWSLDEGAGTVIADSSGNGFDGTVEGALWTEDLFGGSALDCAAVGCLVLPPECWASIVTQASVVLWTYGGPTQPQNNVVVGAYPSMTTDQGRVFSCHVPWSNGNVYFDTGGTEPPTDYDRINKGLSSSVYRGSWHQWAFVKNSETGEQSIYLDGELWLSGTDKFKPINGDTVVSFTIGCRADRGLLYDGKVDDIRLYDKALTADEAKALFYYPWVKAPSPASATIDVDTEILMWTPGTSAVSHNVYLSSDPNALTLVDTVDVNEYAVSLDPGVTYYWRVDEVDAEGNVFAGEVWNLTTLPLEAHFPNIYSGQGNVITPVELSWTPGKGALVHNVFLSTDPNLVETRDPLAQVAQWLSASAYDAGALGPGMTYYWAVDEFLGAETNPGPVWSFAVAPEVVPTIEDPNLVGLWTFDEGDYLTALDSSGNNYHGTIAGGATWIDGYAGGALQFDGTTNVNLPAECWSTIDTQATVTVWMYIDSAVTQSPFTFAAYQDPAVNNSRVMSTHLVWSNGNLYFDTGGDASGFDRINKAPTQAEYADDWVNWAFVKNADTGDQQIYRNGALWHSGTGLTRTMTGVTAFTLGSKPGNINYWRGAMDDFRLYNKALSSDEILQAMRADPARAWNPMPVKGAVLDPRDATFLSWNAGDGATAHDVYVGPAGGDLAMVDTVTDPNIMGAWDVLGGAFDWRVDEDANGVVTPGDVWNFSVNDFLTVTDAQQVMDYNNVAVGASDLVLALDPAQDISGYGFNRLTVRFMGSALADVNAVPEPLSLTVTDAAGVSGTVASLDPNAVITTAWTDWSIALAAFANRGVDLTQVSSVTLSVGDGDPNTPGNVGTLTLGSVLVTGVNPVPVTVENASFEMPAGIKQPGFDDVPGWSTDSAPIASGVEPGYKPSDGSYSAYLKGTDASIWQTTDQTITDGDAFKLTVDARRIVTGSRYDGAQKLKMSLYYEGSRVPIASKTVGLKTGMKTFSLSAMIQPGSGAIGKKLGIELSNTATLWIGVDNVRLEVK